MTEASETAVAAPKWVPGMKSPNPAGRPKGTLSKRDRVAQALNDDAPDVVRKVIEAALAGDMTAAGLVLSRIVPPINPCWIPTFTRRAWFGMSSGAPASSARSHSSALTCWPFASATDARGQAPRISGNDGNPERPKGTVGR